MSTLPNSPFIFWAFVIAWWLAAPFVEASFYSEELRRGSFPQNADSIAIPIFWHLMGWLISTPFVFGIFFWAARPFPPRLSILSLNRNLLILGLISWSLTVAFMAFQLSFVWKSLSESRWLDFGYGLSGCYVATLLNALLQAKGKWWGGAT